MNSYGNNIETLLKIPSIKLWYNADFHNGIGNPNPANDTNLDESTNLGVNLVTNTNFELRRASSTNSTMTFNTNPNRIVLKNTVRDAANYINYFHSLSNTLTQYTIFTVGCSLESLGHLYSISNNYRLAFVTNSSPVIPDFVGTYALGIISSLQATELNFYPYDRRFQLQGRDHLFKLYRDSSTIIRGAVDGMYQDRSQH